MPPPDSKIRALVESDDDAALKAARNAEQRALGDLEAFSRSLAHDLRSPLMGLSGLLQVLEEDHTASLDANGRHYLGMARESTRNLGHVIDALVALARISQGKLAQVPVDLAALARAEQQKHAALEPHRKVTLVIDPALPLAKGDPPRLASLMEALMSNAWKFTSKNATARIELGVDAEGAWFVRDDGPGFDLNGLDRLFTIFQRLHSADEFEGRGLGLATAQQIVHRHGGRIWADSTRQGATIHFTLGP